IPFVRRATAPFVTRIVGGDSKPETNKDFKGSLVAQALGEIALTLAIFGPVTLKLVRNLIRESLQSHG
ncbi:hypothetical protein LINPERHAP2_LOCUS17090, partial [Linum perenne]